MIHNRLFFVPLLLCTLLCAPVLAKGNGYVLKEGKDVPLCREMAEILNLPENAHTIELGNDTLPFTIPARYTNFTPVTWEKTTLDELKPLMDMNLFLPALEDLRDFSKNHEKDWDGKGDFTFEKTRLDFDNTGHIVTVIRFRLPSWHQWQCSVTNESPPNYMHSFVDSKPQPMVVYNGRACTLFQYGGRTYLSRNFIDHALIEKPEPYMFVGQTREEADYAPRDMCDIENIHPVRKKAHKP